MNFCVLIFGNNSAEYHKTMASLVGFKHLTVLHCSELLKINFNDIDSDYTFFIESGDTLTLHARQHLELNATWKKADIIYSDETIVYSDTKKAFNFYKPDYSPEMILSMNYFRNLLCIRTSLLKEIKSIESTCYQNFLYELVLKTLPKCKNIVHIDEALYVSNSKEKTVTYQSFYKDFDQTLGRQQLEKYCSDNGIDAFIVDGRYHGTYRVQYKIQNQPLISIVIPFRDKPELLKACITSILEKSTYKNFEIIGINNGSEQAETLALMRELQQRDGRIQFCELNVPYNFSILNNYAINNFAKGEHIVLLNNDTDVIEPGWIEALLEHSQHPQVGIVGAKLLYSDHTIQHCGVLLGKLLSHAHVQLPDSQSGYFFFPHIVRNYHAVTFACVMIKTELFKSMGGLYEELAIAYNDVDLCARISALGYFNVYTPYAVLYHYESKSRGLPDTSEKMIFQNWEKKILEERTPSFFLCDTFYNKNLADNALDFSEKVVDGDSCWLLLLPCRACKAYHRLGFAGMCQVIMKKLKQKCGKI